MPASPPGAGRDALDAVVLMDAGHRAASRAHGAGHGAHRVITDGGQQPNVVPRRAAVWWYFRDSTAAGAARLFERARRIAEGAALMTDTTVAVEVLSAVWPVRGNRTLAELVEREIELVGLPDWSREEDELARKLQAKVKVPVEGLKRDYVRMNGPAVQKSAANDAGDISWKVPMAKMYFPGNIPNHQLSPLGGGRGARDLDRPQGRAGRRQGHGGRDCRMLEEPGGRGGGKAQLRGGKGRRRIPIAAAAGAEAAGRAQSRRYGTVPAAARAALSSGEAEFRVIETGGTRCSCALC